MPLAGDKTGRDFATNFIAPNKCALAALFSGTTPVSKVRYRDAVHTIVAAHPVHSHFGFCPGDWVDDHCQCDLTYGFDHRRKRP